MPSPLDPIDPKSPVPPFEQVRGQIVELVDRGGLSPGAKLPTVRGLAAELDLAANTVARAYRELEQAGVVVTRGRKGTFVADHEDQPWRPEAERAAAAYAARLRELDVPPAVALDLASRAIRDLADEEDGEADDLAAVRGHAPN